MAKVINKHGVPHFGQMPSVVEALVVDNCDPEGMSRVKVKFPTLPDMPESWWARLSMPMAGKDRGWMTIPEVGDEVLVSFMHGDVQHAVVVGSLYNGVDRPPYANEDGQDNLRVFQSRSGHRVTFDDTAGAERIELVSHNEEIRVVWDAVAGVLSVYSGGDISIEAKTHLHISTEDFALQASGDISIQASKGLVVNSGDTSGVLSSSSITLIAPSVMTN